MDRNNAKIVVKTCILYVALRKESVDRNQVVIINTSLLCVALRKESVDRNDNGNAVAVSDLESLSARRAWIEIFLVYH